MKPKSPLGWGIAATYLIATLLMVWAVIVVDWWSTALTLYVPDGSRGLVGITRDGGSLFSGYTAIGLALALVVPVGAIVSSFNRSVAVLLGVSGIALTAVASQLDSPVTALVQTNAWIPAALAWFFYFGALFTQFATREPQLELEPRPDSSDG